MFTFKGGYFLTATALLTVEFLIALFFKGGFVRVHFGDYLVVILIYCTVRAFIDVSVPRAAFGVLAFSFAVEISQYFQLIRHLGLESSRVAHLILGSSFEWKDLLAYLAGIGTVLIIEDVLRRTPRTRASAPLQ